MKQRIRATCIVELTDKDGDVSILIAEQHGRGYDLLPGGRVERNEAPIIAAIRELREETGLKSEGALKLFEYTSQHQVHHVFYLITERGVQPQPRSDVKGLWKLKLSECDALSGHAKLSRSTVEILTKYVTSRETYLAWSSLDRTQ